MQASIGQQLRQAREARSLSLEQVAQATRMRVRYLEALEAGDIQSLPSLAQARGFLRSYAEYLRLDVTALLTDLEQSVKPDQATQIVPAPTPTPGTPVPQPAVGNNSVNAIFVEVGQRLRRQRELLGLSLEDIERHTRLRQHYLSALEEGNLEKLPSPVQARGMLSNYATFLGMNPEPLLLRFAEGLQARLAARQAETVRESPRTARRSRPLPSFLRRILSPDYLFGGLLAIFLFAFIVWGAIRIFAMRSEQQPSVTAPSIAEVLLATPIPTETPTSDTLVPTLEPAGSVEPLSGQTALVSATAQPTLSTTTTTTPQGVQVYVTVQQRAWMRVTVDGKIQFEGRVIPGSAYSFAGGKQVEILTGNGAALSIFYNQQDYGLLGGFGQIVDVVYTMQGIRTPTATITITPTATQRIPSTLTPSVTSTPNLSAAPGLP